MSQVREQENISAGEVNFTPAVNFRAVAEFAQNLKNDKFNFNGSRFDLQIRKRDDRYVLMLKYQHNAGSDAGEFYKKFTGFLRDYFGPDCRGWSISSPIWVIE